MSAVRAADSTPSPATSAPRRAAPPWLAAVLVALAVGGGLFALAVDAGTYSVESRGVLAVAVWWAVALGVGLGLWPRDALPRAALATGALLAAFAALTGLSMAWAPAPETAFAELTRVTLYAGIFALVVLATRRGDARAWVDGLALGISAVAVLSLLSRCFPDLVGSGEFARLLPNFPTRLTYPLEYWNGLGMFAGLAIPLLLGAAGSGERRSLRPLAIAPVPVIVAVIYFTSSRGAVAVAVVGALAFTALSPRRLLAVWGLGISAAAGGIVVVLLQARDVLVDGPLRSDAAIDEGRSAALLILGLCVAAAVVHWLGARHAPAGRPWSPGARRAVWAACAVALVTAIVAADSSERFDRFKSPPEDPSQTTRGGETFIQSHLTSGGGAGRWQFWGAAVDEWQADPVAGGGAGSFESWWAQHAPITYFVRDAHSLWVETLGELGILGLLLIAGVFGSALIALAARLGRLPGAQRAPAAAAGAALAAFMLGAALDWIWELTAVALVGVACLALLTGPATLPADPHARARPRWALPARLAVAAAALVLLGLNTLPVLSTAKLAESREAAARGHTAAALDDALAARRLEPWSSAPPLQLALVEEETGDLQAAREWIGRAIDENPVDWRLWLIAARVETKLGDARAAARSLRRARSLNPRSPAFTRR